MVLMTHIEEVKKRIFFQLLSLFITYIIVYIHIDNNILLFTPNIPSLMVYNNILDSFFIKLSISFYISCFLNCPFFLLNLLSFIRPGLLKDGHSLQFYSLLLKNSIIWPYLQYQLMLYIYNIYIKYYIYSNLDIFIPGLLQIFVFIKFNIFISILTLFLISFLYHWITLSILYKYRLHFYFFLTFSCSFFLPPDLYLLLLAFISLFIIIESFTFFYIYYKMLSAV